MRDFIAAVLELLDYLDLFTGAARNVAGSTIEIMNQIDAVSTALEQRK